MRSSSTRSAPSRSNSARAARAVVGDLGLVALAFEQEGQRFAERRLVFDDQDAGHVRSPRSCASPSVGRRRGDRLGQADGEGRAAAGLRPDPDVAAVVLHDVLDDAEAEARCRRCCGTRAGSTRKNRSKTRSRSSSGMPTPWSVTAISTMPSVDARRRCRRGSPSASMHGVGDEVVHGDDEQRLVAVDLGAGVAAARRWSMRVGLGGDPVLVDARPRRRRRCRRARRVGSASAACSRDSSMISWVMRARRSASLVSRLAKRRTWSGSSAAWSSASASRLTAPIGVFSSWLMLATKSRRTSSSRYDSVRSSASSST